MKCLRYIVLLVSVLLVAACEQLPLPDTELILAKQGTVELTDNSAVIEIEFHPTAATIQTVTACYTGGLKKEMTHVKGLVYRVELKNLQSDTEYHVYYEVSNVFSTVVVTGNYSFITAKKGEKPNPTVTPEYVDLGLPSGVKWATFNVGATKPEEYGDYFAWGETEPKELYDWSTYKWCDGSYNTLTKYNTDSEYGVVDNKKILESSDDAATANWGGDWRMPSVDEWNELLSHCSLQWEERNGVSGVALVSVQNGNSLFLPAAGVYHYNNGLISQNTEGYYRTNSLDESRGTISLGFSYTGSINWYANDRCFGQPVRPVYDARGDETINEPYFSVSETQKVTFSPGNLQYTQSTNTWSFAENQWDMIGTDNMTGGSVSSDPENGDSKEGTALADKVDLFGWSTSATNFGVSTSTDENDYSGTFVDWGTNKIGNDAPNTWRTLTYDEWVYLFTTRPNASSLHGVAQVNGVNGLILLPENWTCPSGVTFKSGFHSEPSVEAYGQYQAFSADQWSKLEAAGAVFLPAAGYRKGSAVNDVQGRGDYWSATKDNRDNAYYLYFYSDGAGMYIIGRYYGRLVRLVKDL